MRDAPGAIRRLVLGLGLLVGFASADAMPRDYVQAVQERAAAARVAEERRESRHRAELGYERARARAHGRMRAEGVDTMYASTPSAGGTGAMCPVPDGDPAPYSPILTAPASLPATLPATGSRAALSRAAQVEASGGGGAGSLGVRSSRASHRSLSAVLSLPALPPRAHRLPYLPAASAPVEGVVRLVNQSSRSGEVLLEAVDDTGGRFGPVTVPVAAGQTVELSSSDLEQGNPLKGLWSGIGSGTGDWRLELRSSLDLKVLAYAMSADGVRSPLHGVVEPEAEAHRIGLFPGARSDVEGRLRLVNAGEQVAEVTIHGVDDVGSEGEVTLTVPAGTSHWLTSSALASGTGVSGSLGSGRGDWRLRVTSSSPIEVLALSSTSAGGLSNLSSGRRHFMPEPAPAASPSPLSYADAPVPGATSEVVWRLPSASSGVDGLLRLVNRSSRDGEVTLHARDGSDWTHDPVTVQLAGGGAVTLTSTDLELGNAAKGLSAGLGTGVGAWRLEVRSALDVEVLAYLRGADGLLSPLHAVAPRSGAANRHTVPAFGPPEGELWLINRESTPARVRITGVDEEGKAGQPVTLTVAAGGSRTLSSERLSWGGSGVDGYLGAGMGRWRLSVWSDGSLEVMAFERSPSGRLMNVSTGASASTLTDTVSPVGDLDGDGKADVLLRHTNGRWFYYPMDGRVPLTAGRGLVSLHPDLHWRLVGLGDLDGDGKDDVVLRHTNGRWQGYLMNGRTVRSSGSLALPSDTAWRMAGLGDLDGNGTDDVLLRHTDGRWRHAPLDGLSLAASGLSDLALTRNLAWRFAGLGDMDGNGTDDVLLRHDDGRWYLYPMQGARPGAGRGTVGMTRNLAWSLAGVGDLDGDGSDDVLLRHAGGAWFYYPLSGRTVLAGRGLVSLTRNRQWTVMGLGDLGGDGNDDVLLRHADGRWFYYGMSGRELLERGQSPLTRNLAWTPQGAEPEELEATAPETGEDDGATAPAVFASDVSDPVVQGKCVNCHVAGGVSSHTRLVLVGGGAADHVNVNRRVFEDFVEDVEGGAELILNKVQGVSHGGGEQLPAGTTEFESLRRFLSLLGQDTGGPTIAPSQLFDGVKLEPQRSTLRRAAIVFAGRVPTDAEYAAIRSGSGQALRRTIRGLMQGPEFHEFLIRGANDRLLTDREEAPIDPIFGYFVAFNNLNHERRVADLADGLDHNPEYWEWIGNVGYGIGRAPVELIAHVVENDLPYGEVLTADYIMANPMAAEAYGADTQYTDPTDAHEFEPSEIVSYYRDDGSKVFEYDLFTGGHVIDPGNLATEYPHAGILNTTTFLLRYPTTATNRNRARSRWTYYHFLALDVEKSASRTTDPEALADTNNPTMHNPACTVCHTVMDPVAGAFQNYDDIGYYRTSWGGLDSLDDDYKEAGPRGGVEMELAGRSEEDKAVLTLTARLEAGSNEVGLENLQLTERCCTNILVDSITIRDARGAEIAFYEMEDLSDWDDIECGNHWGDDPGVDIYCRVVVTVDVPTAAVYSIDVSAWIGYQSDEAEGDNGGLRVWAIVYVEGDTWYRDMRRPGFGGELVPDADFSLAWLAERIVADPRFAEATVKFWWPAIMGADVAEPPAEGDADFAAKLLASNAQSAEIARLARGFRRGVGDGKPYNLKDLLVEIALSRWFRAHSLDGGDPFRAVALAGVGARRLLTPEELARKTAALTGFLWQRYQYPRHHPAERLDWAGEGNYGLLYGGIDSDGITNRGRDLTSVMAGVAQRHAAATSCPVVLKDFYLVDERDRRLFGGVDPLVTPVVEFGAVREIAAESKAQAQTVSVGGELTAGQASVTLTFVNNEQWFDGISGDRNLRIGRLMVRDAQGALVGTHELEESTGVRGCEWNGTEDDHWVFYCEGSVEVTFDAPAAGHYDVEVVAWADQYGDELAGLEITVGSDTTRSAGARAIRAKLAELHEVMLGVPADEASADVQAAFELFVEVWEYGRASDEEDFASLRCDFHEDWGYFDGIADDLWSDEPDEHGHAIGWDWERMNELLGETDTRDPHHVARAWVTVLAALMADYRYLHL